MITIDLTKLLDKQYELTPASQLPDLPVTAIQGVSAADGEALAKAFGVRTIGDLARNKFVRMAQTLTGLAELGTK